MSRRTLSSPFLLTLVALVALFLVAYALDFLLTFLVKYAGQTFVFLQQRSPRRLYLS